MVDIDPPIACATTSYALKLVYGPSPKPLMDAYTMRGLISCMRSQVNPIRSTAPGPKFSTMTSERRISSVRISLPRSVLVLRVMLRLLQLSIVK